jgi:hypothetical protein
MPGQRKIQAFLRHLNSSVKLSKHIFNIGAGSPIPFKGWDESDPIGSNRRMDDFLAQTSTALKECNSYVMEYT